MSVSPSPTSTTALPCRSDPERWFDRTGRTHALAACLACPARSWCAREALSVKPSWGMWAGIWIDGNLAAAEHYLRAIAQTTTLTTPPPTNIQPQAQLSPRQAVVVIRPSARNSVAAVIMARSSGHCEIMAADCGLDLDAIASRIPGRCRHELPHPAAGYAVCGRCQATLARMESRLSRQLGYLVDDVADAAAVPFYWRQSHWMRLDSAGGATPISTVERIA
jgi:hypothetical protein